MTSTEKHPIQSKKWTLGVIGVTSVLALAITGNGSPEAYTAIGLIVSVVCGGQAAADTMAARAHRQ